MPPIDKKHRKNLVSDFTFPDIKDEDKYEHIDGERLLCDISERYGFSDVNHFRCLKCGKSKRESEFNGSLCKKCKK